MKQSFSQEFLLFQRLSNSSNEIHSMSLLWDSFKQGKDLDEALELLKQETKIDFNEIQKHRSLLHHACNHDHFERTKVNISSKDLIQPLHLACRGGHLKVVQFLLSNGSNINAQDIDGYSCLHYAAYNKHQEVSKFLILQGINVNLKDNQNRTALHRSVEQNHDTITHYLIDAGIDVNIQNTSGWSALHLASYNNFGIICHILLSHNANANLINSDGHKAVHWGYGLYGPNRVHQHTTTDGTDHV